MCVIIITNPKNPISKSELKDAWDLNSDGAGYAYINAKIIKFKKGFTDFETYWTEIDKLQHKHELLLHLRITSRGDTNKISTHPFKVGDLLKLGGYSRKPVVAMNGTIYSQTLDKKRGKLLNDTASYIKDHASAFEVLNQDIIDIIADATSCKWAAATLNGIIYSHNFIKHNGRAYSNLNHLYTSIFLDPYDYGDSARIDYDYDYGYDCEYDYGHNKIERSLTAKHFIEPSLLNQVRKDPDLHTKVEEYVYDHCNYQDCKYCIECISEAESVAELRKILKANEDVDFFIYADLKQ